MAAQALSSLADNALFIAAIALIAQLQGPEWLDSVMKWLFAFAYVLLAAFVGALADAFPKGQVMFCTNALKVVGCLLMFFHGYLGIPQVWQPAVVCIAYGIVGIGAAAYSPAKYGIVTEMLPPAELVKGNGWIEGLTVVSIIIGTVFGGALIAPKVTGWFIDHPHVGHLVHAPANAAILVIAVIYVLAAACNLMIPNTGVVYPPQEKNPIALVRTFSEYVRVLWRDKIGQISLAVTTLFWGAGACLQLIVIKWSTDHLGYSLQKASILTGVAAVGTVVGAMLASQIELKKALSALPVGAMMGLASLLMPMVYSAWSVNLLILLIGALAGYFVVPMNALLQHRGHVLLSAGHSIAVQNFNEQLNILLMVGIYGVLVWAHMPIDMIIIIFASVVTVLMLLFIRWSRRNIKNDPKLLELIGQEAHGSALDETGHAHLPPKRPHTRHHRP